MRREHSQTLRFFAPALLILLLPFFPDTLPATPADRPLNGQTIVTTRPQTTPSPDSNQTQDVGQGWYETILKQQQLIARQIDELRNRLDQNLMTTQDFLDGMSSLFDRTDRLYIEWKRLGGPVDTTVTSQPGHRAAVTARKDRAVGKSLNYLRLSIINFFLGYADSNGGQIADAETQVALSNAWRTRSLPFVKRLSS